MTYNIFSERKWLILNHIEFVENKINDNSFFKAVLGFICNFRLDFLTYVHQFLSCRSCISNASHNKGMRCTTFMAPARRTRQRLPRGKKRHNNQSDAFYARQKLCIHYF